MDEISELFLTVTQKGFEKHLKRMDARGMRKQSEIIDQLTDRELTVNIYITQILLLLLSSIMGVIFFKDWIEFKQIFHWHPLQIVIIGGGSGLIIVVIELVLEKTLPPNSFDDGGINERIFKDKSIFQIFCLVFVIAVAEELFFRGIIQTYFGIIPASVLFAILHIRYLNKRFLFLMTVLISFFLGWIFMLTQNLLITITTHFLIDFILGLILRFRNEKSKI